MPKKNNGEGTFVGNALRFLVKSGKTVAPELLSLAGNITGIESLNRLGGMIRGSEELTQEDKEILLKELELDMIELQEVTKRWEADAHSDSWLSKNVRPMVLVYLVLCTTVVMVLDSANVLDVAEHWVSLLTSLLLTVIGAYFGLREVGKYVSKKYK